MKVPTVTVVGQKGDGPVRQRTVDMLTFVTEWGPFAGFLWEWAREQDVFIDGHRIRLVVHP